MVELWTLEAVLVQFANRSFMAMKGRRAKDNSQIFRLSNLVEEGAIY